RGAWTPLPQPAPDRLADNLEFLGAVQGGMEGTVHDPGGTGRAMAVGAPYRMAGKTGTAQRVSRKGNVSTNPHALPLHLRHQAWFVGYAPAQDPRIAVAVMVEHGGYGGSTAAPIARKVFDAWLLGEYAEPDPDAIPVTAFGARAEAAEASPTPVRAARAAIPGLDAATVEVIRGGPGAGR